MEAEPLKAGPLTVVCPCCQILMEFSAEALHALVLSLHLHDSCPETEELFSERG